jgi:aconitate hydratase
VDPHSSDQPGGRVVQHPNTFGSREKLHVGEHDFQIYRIGAVSGEGLDVASLPYSLKILLENLLRTM